MIFFCQMKDVDADDAWEQVDDHHAEWAAQEYAERKDNDSAGEIFQDNMRDSAIILVKTGHMQAEAIAYKITFDFSKDFSATQVAA